MFYRQSVLISFNLDNRVHYIIIIYNHYQGILIRSKYSLQIKKKYI